MKLVLSAVLILLALSGLTFAHHSAAATYIHGKSVKIEGTLKEFIWRNPHSFMKVQAPDEKGEMQMWVIEGAAAAVLAESGVTTNTLRPGDHVIVINAEQVKITGMKADQKVYHHYTGYPGGMRSEDLKKRLVRKPELVVEDAVARMLPKNKMGKQMFTKLQVYKGDKHPHQAQKPEAKVFA